MAVTEDIAALVPCHVVGAAHVLRYGSGRLHVVARDMPETYPSGDEPPRS